MSIRGARVLVAGACSAFGQRLVEAFLALGAHVVAADALRTRLDELRARLRQHERLWVAECDFGDLRAAHKLLADVARDEPLDTAILVLPSAWADAGADGDTLRAAHERFVQVALGAEAQRGAGRVLLIDAEPAPAQQADAAARERALAAWVAAVMPRAALLGVALCGARVDAAQPAALERMVALSDPEQPAASGFVLVP